MINVKRVYDPASADDGQRYLVDRLWPRGVKKEALKMQAWIKEVAPSDDLRHWEVEEPVLRPDPAFAWESGGLYKSWLLEHDGAFYLFYNAKNRPDWPWVEQLFQIYGCWPKNLCQKRAV